MIPTTETHQLLAADHAVGWVVQLADHPSCDSTFLGGKTWNQDPALQLGADSMFTQIVAL